MAESGVAGEPCDLCGECAGFLAEGKLVGARGFAAENGWFLLGMRAVVSAGRRLRDSLLGRRLGTVGFRLGGRPRLLGLNHMKVGRNFSGGNDCWLEAVTSFAGETLCPRLTIGE